jgi:hydrogenase maturation protease
MILPSTQPTVAIVGLGNLLLMDDGVGIHALQALEANPPPGTTLIDGGTAVLHTADLLEGMDKVVAIDALLGGRAPGSVYLMDGMEANENAARLSIHSCGLREALQFMPAKQRPREILVVGVEPEQIAYHTELSPTVAAALPCVLDTVHAVVEGWARGTPTEHLIRERMCS